MPIRGHVGRHIATGRHCQNWKQDQETIVKLLNRIPVDKGGAGGSLNGRIVAGIAGEGLYQAILRFQNQYYRGRRTGFIKPNSEMLAWMETLALLPSPPPPPAAPPKPNGQWSGLTTRSVTAAVSAGLDDMRLSHAEVVNIIRSTLSDGIISANEMDDLATVSARSKSIASQSRRMLDMLVVKIKKSHLGNGPYQLLTDKHKFAAEMACDFLERPGAARFPKLDRMDVGTGLLMRIANPGLFNQGRAGLCGPSSFLFNVATDNPIAYARFAIDLFEKGKAKIHRLEIEPGSDLRNYTPPEPMDHVDWMTMASIRDSENWLVDYDSVSGGGGTKISELASWLSRAGYVDIRDETNEIFSKGVEAIDSANRLFAQGYRIILAISANMLREKTQSKKAKPDHVVVLRSLIDRSGGKVKLKVYTWGIDDYSIPHGSKDLSVEDFLENFYGYVAGKPY